MDLGGVEQGTFDLAVGFTQRKHKVLVISGGGRFIPPLLKKGVRWFPVPMEKKNPVTLYHSLRKVKRILGEEKPDIIHARSRFPAWIAYLALKKTKGHFVTSIHGFYTKYWYSSIMGKGERVIVISEGLKEHALSFLKVDPQRIRIVYNGFNPSPFVNLKPSSYGVSDNKRDIVIGAVGRLTRVKGYPVLIESLSLLVKEFPSIRLVIVGTGPQEKKLAKMVKKKGLEKIVVFTRGNSSQFLGLFDILVAPHLKPEKYSDSSIFWPGRVGAEAQVAGIPVITTLEGVSPGTFKPGETCFFVPVADPLGLLQAIRFLLTHPEETKRMVEKAKKTALENFSLDRMVERTLSVYEELLV